MICCSTLDEITVNTARNPARHAAAKTELLVAESVVKDVLNRGYSIMKYMKLIIISGLCLISSVVLAQPSITSIDKNPARYRRIAPEWFGFWRRPQYCPV